MHAPAVRRQQADAPIADLVAEALDDDRPIGGHGARGRLLLAQERDEVLGRARIEVVVGGEHLERVLVIERDELARRPADRLAQLVRPADAFPLPERHGTWHARRGRSRHRRLNTASD